MKRRGLAAVLIAVVLTVAVVLPRYGLVDLLWGNKAVDEAEAMLRVAYSTGELFDDSEETILTLAEAAALETEYDAYRSSLHYDTMTEQEQAVYRLLEYAMETGQTNVLVDSRLVPDYERLEEILYCLSYDSPLLEQNLRYEVGDFTTYYDVEVLGIFTRTAQLEGYYLTVHNFDAQWWQPKLEAVAEAQRVVDGLEEGLSELEKAEVLYRHLADKVTYTDYPEDDADDAVYPYLYDGLVKGETHCDGYANSLALLLRLAGIENVEKDYAPEDEVGHTWNCARLDGKWYNLDATGEDYIPDIQSAMHAGFYFAFPDELLEYETVVANTLAIPACEDSGYMPVDGRFAKSSDSGLVNAVVHGYGRHSNLWSLVTIEDFNEKDLDTQLQKVANRLYRTVYWMTFDLHDGSTALLVYDGKLYKD